MAADYSISVLADISEITADIIAELTAKMLAIIQWRTVVLVHAASYSAGGADNVRITVSAGATVTVDWGFQILIDSTVGDKEKMLITAQMIHILQPYTHDAIVTAAFSAGGTYQTEATLT